MDWCRDKTVFLGGDGRFPSTRIRCRQIAESLGCAWRTDVCSLADVPEGMNTFVCTKVGLDPDELSALSKRGTLIWDIHDEVPPDAPIDRYLTSTRSAKRAFEDLGEVSVIPHHHCNMSGAPNVPEFGRGLVAGWIGAIKWLPQ